ncbi:MAG: N-formylglutamate amidohydrolase [Planctomycetota bacterium]
MSILISCETGGSEVPPFAARLLRESETGTPASDSRNEQSEWRGDSHALFAAERLSQLLTCPLIACQTSPQLINVSRSLRHRELFSTRTRAWSEPARRELIEKIHEPFRQQVQEKIVMMLNRFGSCFHLSVCTFESKHQNKYRRGDVGLAYETGRREEVAFCLDWIDDLYDEMSMLKVRRNFPRRGNADSLTKSMRRHFLGRSYFGIEIQLNRQWASRNSSIRDNVLSGLAESLSYVLQDSLRAAA